MAKSKSKVPYELRDARAWDPNRTEDEFSGSDDSEPLTNTDEWGEGGITTESESAAEAPHKTKSVTKSQPPATHKQDEEGWQTVTPKGKASQSKGTFRKNEIVQPTLKAAQVTARQRKVVRQYPQPRRPARPFLDFPRDNHAKMAYRNRQPPDHNFQLHKNANEIEPDRKLMYSRLEEIGVRCNTFLRPPQTVDDKTILIWGDTRGIAKTRAALFDWFKRTEEQPATKSKAALQFAIEKSVIGGNYKREQKRLQADQELKVFQQLPESGRHYEFQGWYPWNVDDINPKDVFGLSTEAFDSVRQAYKCHIVFNDRLECFRIYTDYRDNVAPVLSRIRGAYDTIIQQSQPRITRYMVDPPASGAARKDVMLVKEDSTDAKESAVRVPKLSGPVLDAWARTAYDEHVSRSVEENERWFEASLNSLWPKLKYYDGHLQLRISFGSFQLRRFPIPERERALQYEDFCTKLQLAGVKANMIAMNIDAKAMMARIHNATDLLEPENVSIKTLEDTLPEMEGCYVVHRLDRPSVELKATAIPLSRDSIQHQIMLTWLRYDRKGAQTPLEATIVRLDGKLSWQLKILNEHHLDKTKVDPMMSDLAKSIKFHFQNMKDQVYTGRRVVFRQSTGLKPSQFEQKATFRYRVRASPSWMLVLARCDTYKDEAELPNVTRWEASLSNEDWDSAAAKNAKLRTGELAKWDLNPDKLFHMPEDRPLSQGIDLHSGVSPFFRVVRIIGDLFNFSGPDDHSRNTTSQSTLPTSQLYPSLQFRETGAPARSKDSKKRFC